MPNVELHDAITPIPGVTGATSYHAVLLSTEGGRVTWYVPSMSGRTAEEVSEFTNIGESGTIDVLVTDVWGSQGVGQPYAWNEEALAALEGLGVGIADDAEDPSLAPGDDGVYVASKTWLRAGGQDYIAAAPSDVVLFLPNYSAGTGVRAIASLVAGIADGSLSAARAADGSVVLSGIPPARVTDIAVATALLSLVSSLPSLFGVFEASERLRLILEQHRIATFSPLGENIVGSNPEVEVRDAMLDALEAAVSVVTVHFANVVDGGALAAQVASLRAGHTAGVVASETAHDHLTERRWRSVFVPIFLDTLSIYSSALG